MNFFAKFHRCFFDVIVFLLSKLENGLKFKSISLLLLMLWQLSFIQRLDEKCGVSKDSHLKLMQYFSTKNQRKYPITNSKTGMDVSYE